MKREVRLTGDGSSTLFVAELDEHYHSVHGARIESTHVFVDAGLRHRKEAALSVLEIGFGTGLNAWLTALAADDAKRTITYTALEKYPLTPEEIKLLNYTHTAQKASESAVFTALHAAPWEVETAITPTFTLLKLQVDCLNFFTEDAFHLIYFDAFAPSAQPELWDTSVFESMFRALKKGGELVTYCAKGQVKRNMKAAGFLVEALPGPPGKREMTRALKPY